MDQDSIHMVAASKVPMLKPEINAPPINKKVVEGVETIIAPATAEEKAQRSDQAEEGPTNFALMVYSSTSSNSEFVNEPIVSEPTVKKPVVKTSEAKASKAKTKIVRKNNGAPIIEDWVSDNEEEDVPQDKNEKKTVKSRRYATRYHPHKLTKKEKHPYQTWYIKNSEIYFD
ncbi:hypothetical protein Tco_1456836 [Tanacetum coccineum]